MKKASLEMSERETSEIKMETANDEQPTTKSRQHGAVGVSSTEIGRRQPAERCREIAAPAVVPERAAPPRPLRQRLPSLSVGLYRWSWKLQHLLGSDVHRRTVRLRNPRYHTRDVHGMKLRKHLVDSRGIQ